MTPYTGLGLADGGTRTLRVGARWRVAPSFCLDLVGRRALYAHDDGAAHGAMLWGTLRW